MSAAAQYVAAGLGLLALSAIHGALRRAVDALERTATAQEKALAVVEPSVVTTPAQDRAARCPDYPPES